MGLAKSISTAQEAANRFVPNPEAIKTAAVNTCRNAINTCTGSGYITTEIGKLKDACIDLPAGMVANTLKACSQLITLQPVNASCTLAKGLIGACKDSAKIMVSPLPAGIAAVRGTARTAVKAAKLPITAPLAVYRKGDEWFTRATDLIFGPDKVITGNDNAKPDTPPPAAAGMPRAA